MPALHTVDRDVRFFFHDVQKPVHAVRFRHESLHDLFADKMLAVSNIGVFGRERFKDVYDLIVLAREKPDES